MKMMQGKFALAMLIASSLALGGCFGPFKKKSGGGGGGGGSTEEEGEGEEEGSDGSNKNSGETPSSPATPPPPGAKDGFGCLQGVVTDGFTGQPIAFDASKIFVLIRGTKLTANKVDGIDGQYFICEIPGEDTYPVYAFLDGYMPFESSVQITLTRAKRVAADGQAVIDEVKIADPLEMQNIRLFPTGNTTRDLRIRAVHNGAPVKDAIVDLEALAAGSSGTFSFDGTFANSAGTRILPMRATTGDDGYATFPAAKLSLGAAYKILVQPPIAGNLTSTGHANIVLGVSGALDDDLNTYDMNVVLTDGNEGLKAISCSTNFQSYASDGSLKIMFNRAVSIIDPDNLDGAATLGAANYVGNNTDPMSLVTAVSNNNVAENVSASVSGNVLTLAPKFTNNDTIKALEAADPNSTLNAKNKNATVTWTYANVKLKVTGDEDQNSVPLSSLVVDSGAVAPDLNCESTVRFFAEID